MTRTNDGSSKESRAQSGREKSGCSRVVRKAVRKAVRKKVRRKVARKAIRRKVARKIVRKKVRRKVARKVVRRKVARKVARKAVRKKAVRKAVRRKVRRKKAGRTKTPNSARCRPAELFMRVAILSRLAFFHPSDAANRWAKEPDRQEEHRARGAGECEGRAQSDRRSNGPVNERAERDDADGDHRVDGKRAAAHVVGRKRLDQRIGHAERCQRSDSGEKEDRQRDRQSRNEREGEDTERT